MNDILQEVNMVINGERQDAYGAPEDSFRIIADYWNVYLQNKYGDIWLDPQDVARMMTLFKLARMHGQKYERDNWRDAIGYLAIEADRFGDPHRTEDRGEDD